jgi:NADPH-dependent 2,4-dienoyl-CoA reductase/sulfur reductase-like enzyme
VEHVVVVGGSLAGLRACETLRTEGFAGRISFVGAEPEVPYDRPPLSKKLLAGEWDAERVRLRRPEEFESLNLERYLGVRATGVDLAAQRIRLDGPDAPATLGYDALVIATGAAARRLPGQPELAGIVELRTLADCLAMRDRLAAGTRLVVIGAGFIGLEVAATAATRGCHVTVLEAAPAPLVRGLGAEMGAAVASVHARHGVEIRCGVGVAGWVACDGGVAGVELADGEVVAADVVLVAIGVAPCTGWLADSGIVVRDGIVCLDTLQVVTDEVGAGVGVFAAGDVVRWPNHVFDGHDDVEMRVEHWTNAAEQGAAAAKNALAWSRGAEQVAYQAVPFVWSDQFDSRIQIVGRPHGGDDVAVIAGSTDGAFAALFGWQGRLRAALGVSMPKLVMPFRTLIANGASWDDALARAAELTSG